MSDQQTPLDEIRALQQELSDCRTKFAAEIRENAELKREVAYWQMQAGAKIKQTHQPALDAKE
jgi:FtsZ-binding cell division protein ZapB